MTDWLVNNGEFWLFALNAIYTAFVQATRQPKPKAK